MSDSDSEAMNIFSDSSELKSPSRLKRSTRSATNSAARKFYNEVITLSSDSESNSEPGNEPDSESESLTEGLAQRFQRRRIETAGLKTTGLEDSDDDSNEEGRTTNGGRSIGIVTSSSSSWSPLTTPVATASSSTSTSVRPQTSNRRGCPWKPKAATAKDCSCYLKELEKNVKKRVFPLSQIAKHQVISTGRTIKTLKAWKGFWPPLREFLQNTVDHLNLMDGKTGRRRTCLTMHAYVEKDDETSTTASKARSKSRSKHAIDTGDVSVIEFKCNDQTVCKFIASNDELVIEQQYTYPIASRSLDTGVIDSSKKSDSNQAGGFGDGFKTAAVALLAFSSFKKCLSLKWYFYALKEKTKVEWSFEGLTKEKVATFSQCQVLQVVIDKCKMTNTELDDFHSHPDSSSQYVMRQVISVKDIGKFFLESAVPKFSVFWDLDESSLISTLRDTRRGLGGDSIGPALLQPDLFQGVLGKLGPKAGIYVRGIWVKNSKIKDTIMSFYGNRLEVTGRDRNEVEDDELIAAVAYVMHECNNMPYLETLLNPLRNSSGGAGAKRKRVETDWLLKSPTFLNRVIEAEKDFILQTVFRIPPSSIFISNKTTSSKDPFISWASDFLLRNGVHLIPIEKGSNKILFEEVSEYQLKENCVEILKGKNKSKAKLKGSTQSMFKKFLSYMDLHWVKAVFSTDVKVAFTHDTSIYIPEAKTLSRKMIISVLNVCHSRFEGATVDNYTSLMQAVFEILPSKTAYNCKMPDVDRVLKKAKEVRKEADQFLAGAVKTVNVSDSENDDYNPTGNTVPTTMGDIEDKINKVTEIAKKKNSQIIPESAFATDSAGNDECIRPASRLTNVRVDNTFGGGHILCDTDTAALIKNNSFPAITANKIMRLKEYLEEACSIVRSSIPALETLLGKVYVGYDGNNEGYEAFFDGSGERIVVNLFAFLPKLPSRSSTSSTRSLIHDLVTVVTHEIAHAIEPHASHGPDWRDAHMKMMIEVMCYLESK